MGASARINEYLREEEEWESVSGIIKQMDTEILVKVMDGDLNLKFAVREELLSRNYNLFDRVK